MDAQPEKLFLAKLDAIERVITSTCRRHALYGAEAEDFGSGVKLKLIADDYAVLRKFQGKSLLETYLTTVIVNHFRDYRIQKWGKWRPSASARRLGEVAIQLEQLIYRDGHSIDESVEIMARNFRVDESRAELYEIAARLPQRAPRRVEGEEKLRDVAAAEELEEEVLARERETVKSRAEAALAEALEGLEAEDRLLIKMRFWDGFKVSRIAASLGLEQRPLYSRFDKLIRRLRRELETRGVDAAEVAEIFSGGAP